MLSIHCVKNVRIILVRIFPHADWVLRISPYSVRMRKNTNQNNSKYGHFSSSGKGHWKLKVVSETLVVFWCQNPKAYTACLIFPWTKKLVRLYSVFLILNVFLQISFLKFLEPTFPNMAEFSSILEDLLCWYKASFFPRVLQED